MRKFFIPIVLVGMIVVTAGDGRTASKQQIAMVLEKFVDEVIRPRYGHFRRSTVALAGSIKTLCQQPGQQKLANARESFSKTVLVWSAVEMVRIGPISAENRYERVLFYPDRKGTGRRQVRAILAKKDKRALSLVGLQRKSVATQGLGALEFVLYGTNADALITREGEFRCNYASVIAANLEQIAQIVDTQWSDPQGVSALWKFPGSDNPVLKNNGEGLNEILGVLVNNLKLVHDGRLGSFLRNDPADDRPKVAIYRRSANTFKAITANIAALEALFRDTRIFELLPDDLASIADSVFFEFRQAITTAAEMKLDVISALDDPQQRKKLEYLALVLRSLIERIDEQFAPATGLAAGFSFADGD